jgi:hypothetical protein
MTPKRPVGSKVDSSHIHIHHKRATAHFPVYLIQMSEHDRRKGEVYSRTSTNFRPMMPPASFLGLEP